MGHSYHEFMFIQTRTVLHARLGAAKKRLAWRTVVAFSGGVGLVPRGLAAVGFGYIIGRDRNRGSLDAFGFCCAFYRKCESLVIGGLATCMHKRSSKTDLSSPTVLAEDVYLLAP